MSGKKIINFAAGPAKVPEEVSIKYQVANIEQFFHLNIFRFLFKHKKNWSSTRIVESVLWVRNC